MTKLFFLGGTGYIGGDILDAIISAYPSWTITAMVRTPEKGAPLSAAYPAIKLIYGDLDSTSTITAGAADADIAINCADCDHVPSIRAIIAGLAQTHSKEAPGYYIHTSGSGSLINHTLLAENKGWGYLPPDLKVFNDWDGLQDIYNLPPSTLHYEGDLAVRTAHAETNGAVKTAIIAPPSISGVSRGKVNKFSMTEPAQIRFMLSEGQSKIMGDGKSEWDFCHVQDVSYLFLLVLAEALKGGGKATWDNEGYYLCDAEVIPALKRAKAHAKAAKQLGLIKSEELGAVTPEEADAFMNFGRFFFGSTSRGHGIRARKLLGWEPKMGSVLEEVPGLVETIAKEEKRM